MSQSTVPVLLCCVFSLSIGGCGGSDQFPTAPLSGTVTWDGQPVTTGELQFAPMSTGSQQPGKPGSAAIQADGTFTVSTYGDQDGAVVGTHTITYAAPPPRPAQQSTVESSGQPSQEGPAVASPYAGLVPKPQTVEVNEGGTILHLELVKP